MHITFSEVLQNCTKKMTSYDMAGREVNLCSRSQMIAKLPGNVYSPAQVKSVGFMDASAALVKFSKNFQQHSGKQVGRWLIL